MNRRNFLSAGIGVSLATLIPDQLIANSPKKKSELAVIKPPRLKIGDKFGLVAPASFKTETELKVDVERIKAMGFEPVYTNQILGRHGYFSGTDKERADDFNKMIQNTEVKGIFAFGGYGCTRILDLIDYKLIKKNPKVIVGYSDATALINTIFQRTGLITFNHGRIGRTIYGKKQFENVVINPKDNYIIENCAEDLQKSKDKKEFDRYTINSGIAKGKLVGGTLGLICSLLGTPNQIDCENKIVMIEAVDTPAFRFDRELTHLINSGELTKASGIAFGVCANCKPVMRKDYSIPEIIEDRIKPLNVPSVYGLSFGHIDNNFTFPIGLNAELNADNKTIKLLEKAVI